MTFWSDYIWNNNWATLSSLGLDHGAVLGTFGFHQDISYLVKLGVLSEIFGFGFALSFDASFLHFLIVDLDW